MGGFEPASQLPPAKKVRPLTSGPCDRYALFFFKINNLEVSFSAIHTV